MTTTMTSPKDALLHPVDTGGRREFLMGHVLMWLGTALSAAALVRWHLTSAERESVTMTDVALSALSAAVTIAVLLAGARLIVRSGHWLREGRWRGVADPTWLHLVSKAIETAAFSTIAIVFAVVPAAPDISLVIGFDYSLVIGIFVAFAIGALSVPILGRSTPSERQRRASSSVCAPIALAAAGACVYSTGLSLAASAGIVVAAVLLSWVMIAIGWRMKRAAGGVAVQ